MYESIESDTRSTTLALPRESSEKLFDEYLASLDTPNIPSLLAGCATVDSGAPLADELGPSEDTEIGTPIVLDPFDDTTWLPTASAPIPMEIDMGRKHKSKSQSPSTRKRLRAEEPQAAATLACKPATCPVITRAFSTSSITTSAAQKAICASKCGLDIEECGKVYSSPVESSTAAIPLAPRVPPSRSPSRKTSIANRSASTPCSSDHDSPNPKMVTSSLHLLAKEPHSVTERRYRDNLNDKFSLLRSKLPSMAVAEDEVAHHDNSTTVAKATKADILTHATTYVLQTSRQMQGMAEEIRYMRKRMEALEKLASCEDCWLLSQVGNLRVAGEKVEEPLFP